jgi:hypothetical protein
MEKALSVPPVSKTAFWDVDFEMIDFEESSTFVMAKVFNHGTWMDIIALLRFYGLERIRREVIQVRYLKDTALAFLCTILDLEEKDFVSYHQKQARKPFWNI